MSDKTRLTWLDGHTGVFESVGGQPVALEQNIDGKLVYVASKIEGGDSLGTVSE